jgi:hypothetical protein
MDGRGNSASRELIPGMTSHGLGAKLLEYALTVGIFLGSLALWVVVPFGSLWVASLIGDDAQTVVFAALFICPIAMLLCGLGLGAMYRAYLRVSDAQPTVDRTAWLGSLSGDRKPKRGRRPVLDFSLTFSAATAIVLLLVWFFLFAENYSPAGFVP